MTQRIFPVLDGLTQRYPGETVLVVMHGGAMIATLGSIAPGRTGLPSDDNPYNLHTDTPGGAYFTIEHSRGTWRMTTPSEDS